jgi:hypothetical protein
MNVCCCPETQFDIFKTSNKNAFQGYLKIDGDCKAMTQTTITVNFIDSVNPNVVKNLGSFTMTNSGQLEVSLERMVWMLQIFFYSH